MRLPLQRFESDTGGGAVIARYDDRFRVLLGEAQWASLPDGVRKRFSKRIAPGESVIYTGLVRTIRHSRAGWGLAHLLRFIGAPLPLGRTPGTVSVVAVTEDRRRNGQFWTRIFATERGYPQVIRSSKRFSGATGLEEAIGYGLVMALTASCDAGVLVFRSQRYLFEFGPFRVVLPKALTPGTLTVSHRELSAESFLFTLHLEHPLLGELVHQEVVYGEEGR